MQQARMNRTDSAELTKLVTDWLKKKRGLVPKGYKLVFWVSTEKLEPSPNIEVRVMERTNGKKPVVTKVTSARKSRPRNKEKAKALPIEELCLRTKAVNILKKKKINTVGDLLHLVTTREDDLYQLPNFGTGSIQACKDSLKAWGLL